MKTAWAPGAWVAFRERISTFWKRTRRATTRILGRHRDDHIIYLAGSLAFFTLTALIPISAVSLSLFSAYISEEQEEVFYNYILEYVFPFSPDKQIKGIDKLFSKELGEVASVAAGAPTSGTLTAAPTEEAPPVVGESAPSRNDGVESLEENLRTSVKNFIDQARKLKWIGLIFLIITSIWLFDSIEDAFNGIWRADQRRPFIRRFTTFWTVLTLTPLLMVGPIFFNRYVQSHSFISKDWVWLWNLYSLGQTVLPYLLTWFAVWLLYVVVPNGTVAWRPAAISAFAVAVLWEVLKPIFAVYAVRGVTNQILYGSLSLVALVLLWTYYTWWLILLGFEVTAYLHFPDWDQATPSGDLAEEIALFYAWGGLYETGKHFQSGKGGVSTEHLSGQLGLHKIRTLRILEALEEKGILARDRKGLWYPAVPLSKITWNEVARALEYEIDPSHITLSDWLDSALQARGIRGYHQDTRNLPTLAAIVDSRVNGSVLAPALDDQSLPETMPAALTDMGDSVPPEGSDPNAP